MTEEAGFFFFFYLIENTSSLREPGVIIYTFECFSMFDQMSNYACVA